VNVKAPLSDRALALILVGMLAFAIVVAWSGRTFNW
jgi:hypothetical protein